tara:strand:- start:345 stop:488 length:144 start_codon:yes stop_codon:yes gene_type:complete
MDCCRNSLFKYSNNQSRKKSKRIAEAPPSRLKEMKWNEMEIKKIKKN